MEKQNKKLGFGLMRLPKQGKTIDMEQTKAMVDRFLDAGFTFFDTAWAYDGSEEAIREALVERYPRDRFFLSTKLASWIKAESREEVIGQLDTSLKRTGAGYFDYYLLHNIGGKRTEFFDRYGVWDFLQEKKAQGLIRHIGFSAHTTPEDLDGLLTKHPEVELVLLQVNYADWEAPSVQARACYEVARRHGKLVNIMEPVKGGMLASPPERVAKVFREAEPGSSPASWALRFAADLEGVLTVLSGMSSLGQMEENIATLRDFTGLTPAQRETLQRAREELAKAPMIPCTGCEYCAKVCPMEIGISGSFTAMNTLRVYGDRERALRQLDWRVKDAGKKGAAECVACGACEAVCPQHISIREELRKAAEAFPAGGEA